MGATLESMQKNLEDTWCSLARQKAKDRVKANLIVQGIKDPELQERVSKLLKSASSFEDFVKNLQDLYPALETDLSILGEISKVSHLPYDPKPEQVVKLLETPERLFDKLNLGVMTEERKLMELSSKPNDKPFVEWTKDDKLFARMHSYGSLKDFSHWEYFILMRRGARSRESGRTESGGVHPRVTKNYINFIRRGWIVPPPKDV